ISTGSGFDLESRHAEPVEMRAPGGAIGKAAIGMFGQAGDDRSGKCTAAHIGQRFGVDDIIAMACTQQLKKVETALGGGGAEPGELRIANLGAVAVGGL